MFRRLSFVLLVAFVASIAAHAQSNPPPPRSDDRTPGESSSKDTRIDLSPPAGDAKMHPDSGVADDVLELRPYDPHKAEKDVEIGDFYFKQQNYRAAASRYEEALEFKPNDAEATFKLGQSQEKLGEMQDALVSYQNYLKILPDGPRVPEIKAAMDRINNPQAAKEDKKQKKKKLKIF